jgi:hypothetical protein
MNKYIICLLFVLQQELSLAQQTVVINHVAVIDVKAGKVNADKTVVIRGNKISSISIKAIAPKNSIIVDGSHKFLIPGLWDMHAHALTNNRYEYVFPLLIANGITGVREMGSNLTIDTINQLRQDVIEGKLLGPRFGAIAYRLFDGPESLFSNVAVEIATPEEGRQLVRIYKQRGADFIKPYNLLSRETYLAIVDEAKKQHIPLEGHVPFSMTPAEVSDLGQRSIEHNFGILLYCSKKEADLRKQIQAQPAFWGRFEAEAAASYDTLKGDSLYRQMVRNGTWSCPTLILYRPLRFTSDSTLMQDSLLQYIPTSVREDWHETFTKRAKIIFDAADRKKSAEMRMFIVGDMYRTGVRLLAGTDMPNPYTMPGYSLHQELELLVQSGLPPVEALRAATLNPAQFLGRETEMGTVEQGKWADLVLLNANPLEDIRNTRKIEAVIVNGKLVQRKDLDKLLNEEKQFAKK